MFNVVEHIVLTDAKIRNASLRNWKSYSVVTTEPDTNSVIIKSPDRDIAADTKTASESGAMYRVNLETGEVNLVSKTKRYDPRSGKYVEDYVNVKNVDDFIRYNYTKSPNGNPKKDPMRFDAENNATRYTAEQIFGDTNPNRFLASLFEDGDIVVVDAMSNDLPLYFLLPQTLKTIADSGSHVNATFENDGASLSAHSNDGMHLVKAEWNKKDKTWVFRQASNNWQNSANYRSQMPMELLQMVMRPFEKSSGLTLSSEKLAELTQHKMLHEEYHIAKMLLARDRASASPKHLDISKVGQKLLFPTTGNMQDASTGTWFSSSPKFMEGNADNIPLQREQSAVILDTDNDPYLDTSREALDEYTSMTKKAYDTTPEDMTFYRDENTRGGIIKSGTDKNPVLQVSTDIWDTSVGQFLTDTPYDTTVEDRSAITLSGDELETVFSASPKLRDAAYNANKYVFAPFRALSTFATLALDVSSLAIQLGTQIRNPLRLMKAILCTIPEAVAFGTNDIGFMFGNLIHAKRVANRMAGRGNWATQSLDLGPRYYNFIMNSIVDRWNKTHKWSTPITMSDLITKYYMQGAYSDWYRQHEKNALKDPSKYKDIIDTPWTSDRENSFANELPTALFPAARRWDMSRQLLIDLCMIQNALAAVEAGRKLKVGANGKSIEEWEINRNIRARLSDFAKEFGVSSHADSKTQAPLWKILAKIVQYPQTAPGYNRSFAQYWGFTPFLGIKRSINDVARVATANGPKWLRGDIYNIESDEVYNKYQTNWSKDLKARDKLTTIAAWSGLMILNSVLNWNEHQKENPGEEFDVTEWWNVTSKRFGYNRLNDNWVFQIPVLGRMSQYIKPLTALADKSNYGPKEKIQALRETMVNTYMKNKINNAGQYVISSVLGKTYDGRPAYERNQGLRLAVANDVRAPMYFHPAGYLMPNQSNLTMDTLTFAHTNQYYDDLLKLAVFSQMNKKQLTLDELNRVASMPNRIAISKKAANELFIKGMIGRLAGLNLMYEPKEYQLVNKEPVSLDSDVTLGRFAYMVRDWYKYPNLFQTFRQNPSDVFFGYPIDNIGGQALGLPASESTSRAVRNPNMRLPVSNVNRALIDKARSEQ
jgi:hypothetical protein